MDGASAGGALVTEVGEEIERLGVGGALFEDHADDSGDDLARFLDDYRITDANIFSANFFLVVKSSATDRAAAEEDGLEFGDWGEGASSSDLDGNGVEFCLCLFGDKLPSFCPARSARGEAGSFSLFEVIEFNDRAIGFIGEGIADGVERLNSGHDLVGGGAEFREFGGG